MQTPQPPPSAALRVAPASTFGKCPTDCAAVGGRGRTTHGAAHASGGGWQPAPAAHAPPRHAAVCARPPAPTTDAANDPDPPVHLGVTPGTAGDAPQRGPVSFPIEYGGRGRARCASSSARRASAAAPPPKTSPAASHEPRGRPATAASRAWQDSGRSVARAEWLGGARSRRSRRHHTRPAPHRVVGIVLAAAHVAAVFAAAAAGRLWQQAWSARMVRCSTLAIDSPAMARRWRQYRRRRLEPPPHPQRRSSRRRPRAALAASALRA